MNDDQLRGLESLILGDLIGRGSFRSVYEHNLNANMVVKVEDKRGVFHNIREWQAWLDVSTDADLKKWFAPCHYISACGLIMIQERTYPTDDKYPDKVPGLFADLKRTNWGLIKGRLVCHDYAYNMLTLTAGRRLRKADWW